MLSELQPFVIRANLLFFYNDGYRNLTMLPTKQVLWQYWLFNIYFIFFFNSARSHYNVKFSCTLRGLMAIHQLEKRPTVCLIQDRVYRYIIVSTHDQPREMLIASTFSNNIREMTSISVHTLAQETKKDHISNYIRHAMNLIKKVNHVRPVL